MSFKRSITILFLLLILILVGTVYTYGFFTSEDLLEGNKISTGEFPKSNIVVNMYASIGPLYENAIPGEPLKHTTNYVNWLSNSGEYVVSDLVGNPLNVVGEEITAFKNIPINNKDRISPRATIGSAKFNSWMGEAISDTKSGERGTMIHSVIAISNGIHELDNVKKINLREVVLEIGQWDIYNNSEDEYFELSQNKLNKPNVINFGESSVIFKNNSRIKTYNWTGEEYVVNQGYPSEPTYPLEIDLIIFDIGSKGNYTYVSREENEKGLLDIYEKITGNGDHYSINSNGHKTSLWNINNHMNAYTSVIGILAQRNIQRIPLIGMKTKVTLKYDNKIIDTEPYLINIGEL